MKKKYEFISQDITIELTIANDINDDLDYMEFYTSLPYTHLRPIKDVDVPEKFTTSINHKYTLRKGTPYVNINMVGCDKFLNPLISKKMPFEFEYNGIIKIPFILHETHYIKDLKIKLN